MSEGQVFPVRDEWAKRAHMDAAAYEAACRRVEEDPDGFWRDVASRLDWIEPGAQLGPVALRVLFDAATGGLVGGGVHVRALGPLVPDRKHLTFAHVALPLSLVGASEADHEG